MQKEIIFRNAHLFIGVSKRQFNDFIKRAKKIKFGFWERAFKIEELNHYQLKLDIHARDFRFSFEDKELTFYIIKIAEIDGRNETFTAYLSIKNVKFLSFHNYKEYFHYNNPVKLRRKIKVEAD